MSLARGRDRRRIARALCGAVLIVVAACAWAGDAGQPTMLSRDTKIFVNHDGSIDVSEITRISATAPTGFHRDLALPGRKLKPDDVFVIAARENARPVNAHVVPLHDGVRIEVGTAHRTEPRTFEIDYRVLYGAIDHGRLYWPLTMAGNRMPLQRAHLGVSLPEETPPDRIHARFLLDGADARDDPGEIHVKDTHATLDWSGGVAPGEVLGAVVAFPMVAAAGQSMPPRGPAWLFHGPLWLAVLALYYLGAWFFATGSGRDKPVIVEYAPPPGWSAGAIRLLWHGDWDRKCFATAVLGVAAKGGLTLGKQPDGTWVGTRTGDADIPALTADERTLRAALFTFGGTASFSVTNADSIDVAELAYRRALESRCAREHPVDPALLLIPGWLVALPAAMLLFFGHDSRLAMLGELFVPSLVGALAVAILVGMIPRRVLHAVRAQAFLVAVLCVAGLMGGAERADWLAGAVLLAGQVAASWWLPRQPRRDTPLLRKLRGFRWYLGTAEQQEMQARYKPSLHPELHASLLPFAMALDVEVAWNARFAGSVASTQRPDELAGVLNPDHDRAALELLEFAQSIAAHAQPASGPGD